MIFKNFFAVSLLKVYDKLFFQLPLSFALLFAAIYYLRSYL